MPEIQPEKNLVMYRQCEIRRPSPPRTLRIDGKDIYFAGGYYYDIVWIKNGPGIQKGKFVIDKDGEKWIIAEVYGSKLMSRSRHSLESTD